MDARILVNIGKRVITMLIILREDATSGHNVSIRREKNEIVIDSSRRGSRQRSSKMLKGRDDSNN